MKLTITYSDKDKNTFVGVKEVSCTRSNGFIRVHWVFSSGDKYCANKVRSLKIEEEV